MDIPRVALLHPDCDPALNPLGSGVLWLRPRHPDAGLVGPIRSQPAAPPSDSEVLGWLLANHYLDECHRSQTLAWLRCMQVVTSWDMAQAQAHLLGLRGQALDQRELSPALAEYLPQAVARHAAMVPLARRGDTVRMGMLVEAPGALEHMATLIGRPIEPLLVGREALQGAFETVYQCEAPALAMRARLDRVKVRACLSGPLAQVSIEHDFVNLYHDAVEAIYYCPLPRTAAVYRLEVDTGGGVLRGQVLAHHPRSRPGLPIPSRHDDALAVRLELLAAGARVRIALTYAERLETLDGETTWHVPLQVRPASPHSPERWAAPALPSCQVTVEVETHGLRIDRLHCSQPVERQAEGDRLVLELPGVVQPRDFTLRYRLAAEEAVALLVDDGRHFALSVLPPQAAPPTGPQDVVLLVDRASLSEATAGGVQEAVARVLGLLGPSDRFRLLVGDEGVEGYAAGRRCPPDLVEPALRWYRQVEARGGPDLSTTLRQLVDMPLPEDRLTWVVLITQGWVTYPAALLEALEERRDSRLRFLTVGPQDGLLRRMAGLSRGRHETEAWHGVLAAWWEEQRAVVALNLELHGDQPELEPALLPDLCAGRPATVLGRGTAPLGVAGRRLNGDDWQTTVRHRSTASEALGVLWASARLQSWQDQVRLGATALLSDMRELAVQYGVLSHHTVLLLGGQPVTLRLPGRAAGVEHQPEQPTEPLDAAPVVRLVNLILSQAINDGATQVHLEPTSGPSRVLYRVGGLMHEVMTPPAHVHRLLLLRLKAMAGLSPAEPVSVQEARIGVQHQGQDLQIRMHLWPTAQGEAAVLHLVSGPDPAPRLADLPLPSGLAASIQSALRERPGLTLFLGPADVATRMAYACASLESSLVRRIVTLEEAIEQRVVGLSQTVYRMQTGTVDYVLAQLLAQDPDTVLVTTPLTPGALQRLAAAATRRRVLLVAESSNPATTTASLLRQAPGLADVLELVVGAESLAWLCPECRAPHQPGLVALRELGLPATLPVQAAFGCLACSFSGQVPHLEWQAWPVSTRVRFALARASTVRDVRRSLMGSTLALARQRLERGDVGLPGYRRLTLET